MNLLGSCFLISSILVLTLGVLVVWHRRESSTHRVFSIFCLSIFGWLFGYGLMQLPQLDRVFWARFGHSGAMFVPITYLHFTMRFLKLPHLRRVLLLYYLVGLVSLAALWLTKVYLVRLQVHAWGIYPVGGPAMWIDFILLCVAAVSCWVLFIVRCKQVHQCGPLEEHNRMKYGCIGMTILSLGGLDYLPKLTSLSVYPFGFATTSVFVGIFSYAILRRRLMDINVAIRKSLVYSLLVAFMTAIYFSFVLLAERAFQGVMGYRSLIGSVIAGFVIALGFNPLKEFAQRFIDRLFFHSNQVLLVQVNERLRHEVARGEKLKAVATLAAGMAHEIKNPLASIKTFAEYLPEKYDDPVFREKFTKIMGQEVDKMNILIQRLLEFAKPTQPQLKPVRVSELVGETVDFLHGTLVQKQIQVETTFAATDEVRADPGQLKQVFLNILLNSIEAMDRPGRITISSERQDGHLDVTLADTGPGISKKGLAHAFDPFYTTKPGGTGLGLSVVHSIIREHGGRVGLESAVGKGTTVHVTLPLNGGTNGSDAHSDRG